MSAPRPTVLVDARVLPDDVLDAGLLAVAAVATVLVVADVPGPVRAVLVLLTLVLLPGRAAVRLLPPLGAWARWALSLVLGPALLTLGATAMAFTGSWHPFPLAAVLSAAAALVVLLDLRRAGRTAVDPDAHVRTSR